jgi:Zn ribbon nucleic-acid-binding protein
VVKWLRCADCGKLQQEDESYHDYQPCIKCGHKDSLEEVDLKKKNKKNVITK